MSGDRRSSSFGDPNAHPIPHPPTPQQTPDTAVLPSPVFQTPRPKQGSFSESGGWTPTFAEDYSVFNSTPGNLRGTNGPFLDFIPFTTVSTSSTHKRLLSAESVAIEIASHATHFSPDPNVPLPPVDPSYRIPSTPRSKQLPYHTSPPTLSQQQTPGLSKTRSSKKVRRGSLTSEPPTQTATPPPSSHKGTRKLAPKATMNDDQAYGQPDFSSMAHQQDMTAFIGSGTDMFGYPMSAPVNGPTSFWDPASMGMELDFSVADPSLFQPGAGPSHDRGMGSFDWSNDPQLFQEPSAPAPAPTLHGKPQPARRERALAPKPAVSEQLPASAAPIDNFSMQDPFGITHMGDGVNPGLLLSRPQTSAMDLSFNAAEGSNNMDSANDAISSRAAGNRRTGANKEVRNGKLPDRAIASSPIKPSFRPGLSRSFSENRGKKALGRGSSTSLAPSRSEQNLSGSVRPSGRVSPFKHQKRLSALASIPESSPQNKQRASVRFTIDSKGRARAESTIMTDSRGPGISRSQSARVGVGRASPDSDDDSSETDDEPIIIPSRNTSFNASFALPDPLKPVGSIFHSSRRSISDKSTSTITNGDGLTGAMNDEESEAETVTNEHQGGGDAASELRKVMESRQRRSLHNGRPHPGTSKSPTPQASAWPMEGRGVRCVCHRNRTDESDGYMMQCESCEMWLHGRCINVTRRTIPSVYICPFCSQTPNMRGGRMRDTGMRNDPLGIGAAAPSPLANRSMRTFR
ncbi:PHD-finger domain-containing protein [Sarocladium implicatum]|nr:PHD-finger domain-containing protein [Sarocladium implicatum]